MNFEELLALVTDNEQAVNFINTVKETTDTNVQTINKNETLINNLKGDLDKFKQGNSLVKTTLGIEQLNEDSLSEALGKLKKGSSDEATLAEINNLKSMLEGKNGEFEQLQGKFTDYQRDMNTKDIISKYSTHESVVPSARVDVENRLRAVMSYDDNNKPIFKNEDGSTKYINGVVADFDAVFAEIKTTSPHLFSATTASGGGSQGNNTNSGGETKEVNPSEHKNTSDFINSAMDSINKR